MGSNPTSSANIGNTSSELVWTQIKSSTVMKPLSRQRRKSGIEIDTDPLKVSIFPVNDGALGIASK